MSQAATEALVSQIFNKWITRDTAYKREIEKLTLYKRAYEALCENIKHGQVDEQVHCHNKPLSAVDKLLSGLTWVERGLLYLLYQDMPNKECAEIFNITDAEFLRSKASLMERIGMLDREL